MEVIDPGHHYRLHSLDGGLMVHVAFVKRVGPGYPGNQPPAHGGTNLQEILRMCIDRVKYLDRQIHSDHNDRILEHLRWSILELELRAAARHGRELVISSPETIEEDETCPRCGHIGCEGVCRKLIAQTS